MPANLNKEEESELKNNIFFLMCKKKTQYKYQNFFYY